MVLSRSPLPKENLLAPHIPREPTMLKCQISADSPKYVCRGQRAVNKEAHKVRQRSVTVTAVGKSYIISIPYSRHSAGTISHLITILKVRCYYVHFTDMETEDEKN